MTSVDHPSYPNPTIQEAVCEIHFQLREGITWDPSWYGAFFKQVQDQFPDFQPVIVPQIQLHISQHPPPSPVVVLPQVMRYQHAFRNVLLQLSENRIVVNILPRYPGWQQVREDIRYAWENTRAVVDPERITRIGLRYINRIERSAPSETLDAWLVPNEYIPHGVLRSQPGFVAHVEVRHDQENRVRLTVGDQEPSSGGYGAFIFDIDRMTERDIAPDTGSVLDVTTELHDHVWDIFQSARGDRLERLLKEELV